MDRAYARHLRKSVEQTRRIVLLAIAAGLSGCMTAPVKPTPVWLGQISQGAPTVAKPIQSWRELKFKGMIRQQTDFSCGAAALATIFKYAYDKDTNEQQVLVNMLKVADPDLVREKGFSLLDMKNYVQAIGMQGQGYSIPYSGLQGLKIPGIVLLNIKGYKHFVVVRKVDGEFVHVADPALGNRVMPRKLFAPAWNGIVFVVVGEGYNPNSALRNAPPPLSAKRLFEMRSPVPNADIYDFGLGPALNFTF